MSQEDRKDQIKALITPSIEAASADPSVPMTSDVVEVEQTIDAVASAMSKDGQTVNQLGLEKPHQSRVTWGALSAFGLAFVAWLKFLIASLPFDFVTFDFTVFLALTGTMGGAAYVIYGRWFPNLNPLFWRGDE